MIWKVILILTKTKTAKWTLKCLRCHAMPTLCLCLDSWWYRQRFPTHSHSRCSTCHCWYSGLTLKMKVDYTCKYHIMRVTGWLTPKAAITLSWMEILYLASSPKWFIRTIFDTSPVKSTPCCVENRWGFFFFFHANLHEDTSCQFWSWSQRISQHLWSNSTCQPLPVHLWET